jgi:MSHA pilin protein MshD
MCICDRRNGGFSLVELIIFIVVVSVAVVGVLSVMNITTRYSADPMVQKQTLAIAESMMEEILLKDFANPSGGFTGAATQANRPLFDDVGDYNGFTEPAGIYTIDGTAIPALAAYSLAVTVADTALGPAGKQVAGGEAKLITVTVTNPTGGTVVLTGYRTHYGV